MEEPQKLFRLPGTIEEEEEEKEGGREKEKGSCTSEIRRHQQLMENAGRAESPLLGEKTLGTISSLPSIPRNITLVRVSTQSSSIAGVTRQDSTRSRYRAGPTRKLRRRAVLKNGECNVLQSRISKRSLRFLQDIFTTLVDTQWRWTLLCFSLSFVLSWLGFAVIWWLIAFTHGDFEENHLPNQQADSGWTPCIYNINSFTSCFLFSIETQHTIGYGSRSTTEECPEAIFVMCVQSIAGVMIQAFMVGIVFAKMSRPKQRTQTLLFSRNAVVCQRDGQLCLMFRVGDMRKSHIIGATVRAQLIRSRTTKEGECLPQNQQELAVGTDGQNGDLFFIWPTTIVHKINADSPFYSMSAEDMLTERFELVVILEGTIESTGQTTQARSSYLPQEILWGHRFEPMVAYSKERQGYEVDYSIFNSTIQVDTPLCSGKELAEFYRVQDELRQSTGCTTIDEEQMQLMGSCPEIHCHGSRRRPMTVSSGQHRAVYTENTRSYNSLEESSILSRNTCREAHSASFIHGSQIPNVHRDNSGQQLKIVEIDHPEDRQAMSEMEVAHLPEAINREILRNSEEILLADQSELSKEEFQPLLVGPYAPIGSKRNYPTAKFLGQPEEGRKSLQGSKRNLNYRNAPVLSEEDGRSPSGSKRYLLLALDGSAESRENLIRLRRHTGSRERLEGIRKTVRGVKGSKETPELRSRRRKHHGYTFENTDKLNLGAEKISKAEGMPFPRVPTVVTVPSDPPDPPDSSDPPDQSDRSDPIETSEPPVSPESGFFDGNQSETIFSPEAGVIRNRRSYEDAQLQDVNGSLPNNKQNRAHGLSDSDESTNNKIIDKNHANPPMTILPKQNHISYTTV